MAEPDEITRVDLELLADVKACKSWGQEFDMAMSRLDEMKISDREAQIIVGYLCGAAPAVVLRALDHVRLLRDAEPRHQPEWDALPLGERARRQAAWLNARGQDVCPACLGFRKNGVCPGGHDA